MGFGVSPIDGGALISQAGQLKQVSTEDMIEAFNQGSKVIDNEVQAMNKEMMGLKTPNDAPKAESNQKVEHAAINIPHPEAELAGELSKEQLVDRAKRRKSKWEAKMDELAGMEGQLGFEQLEGEEKSVFSQFFDNMARIKSLRAKLKQLERQEELLEEEKRRKKLDEQNEERRRRLQQMQNQKPGSENQ